MNEATGKRVFVYSFMQVSLTVDVLILNEDASRVMLIQRKFEPFKEHWAITGGFVDVVENEEPEHAAYRELMEETGLKGEEIDGKLTQIGCFANGNRDPRGYTCTLVYAARVNEDKVKTVTKAGDDAKEVRWFNVKDLHNLQIAFDHREIMQRALSVMEKADYIQVKS